MPRSHELALASSAAAADPTGPLHILLTPERLYDSRTDAVPLGGAKLASGSSVIVTAGGFGGSGILVAAFINVTVTQTEKGPRSQSAVIQNPPVAPVLLDGIFAHTERPTQNFESVIPIPNINCPGCVLQVIEFMADHPGAAVDGGHSYHHCAILNITADPAKPIDKQW